VALARNLLALASVDLGGNVVTPIGHPLSTWFIHHIITERLLFVGVKKQERVVDI
jgi:hypothetical protein